MLQGDTRDTQKHCFNLLREILQLVQVQMLVKFIEVPQQRHFACLRHFNCRAALSAFSLQVRFEIYVTACVIQSS